MWRWEEHGTVQDTIGFCHCVGLIYVDQAPWSRWLHICARPSAITMSIIILRDTEIMRQPLNNQCAEVDNPWVSLLLGFLPSDDNIDSDDTTVNKNPLKVKGLQFKKIMVITTHFFRNWSSYLTSIWKYNWIRIWIRISLVFPGNELVLCDVTLLHAMARIDNDFFCQWALHKIQWGLNENRKLSF